MSYLPFGSTGFVNVLIISAVGESQYLNWVIISDRGTHSQMVHLRNGSVHSTVDKCGQECKVT